MLFSGSRGVKTGRWYPNEILRDEDINFVGFAQYQNITDLLASMVNHGYESGSGAADRVLGGLQLRWNNLLTSDLTAGHALSFTGRYFSSGVWAFAAAAGEVFSVVLPEDASVAVDAGDGSNPRYDTVEVRPVQTPYNSQSREFKDPITGTVTSAVTSTRTEYGVEFQVKKGTPAGSPSAPATTAGWIKIAEIHVIQSASDIDQDDIKDVRDSDTWTTDASGTEYSVGIFENLTISEDLEVGGVLTVDTINESTTNAGVTIEGLLLKDSVLSKSGGNVTVESVVFNGGAVSSVTTLGMSGALSGGTTIDISGALTTDTINEHTVDAGVTIEGVALENSGISSVTTLAMTGALSGGTTIDISGALTADTINEHTGAAGVTIEGVLLKDSLVSVPGASITFSGANADRTISFASDASLFWDEAPGIFVFDRIVSIYQTGITSHFDIGFAAGAWQDQATTIINFASNAALTWDQSDDTFKFNSLVNIPARSIGIGNKAHGGVTEDDIFDAMVGDFQQVGDRILVSGCVNPTVGNAFGISFAEYTNGTTITFYGLSLSHTGAVATLAITDGTATSHAWSICW